MSCLRSTTSAVATWPFARMPCAPATTCAAVTTMCGARHPARALDAEAAGDGGDPHDARARRAHARRSRARVRRAASTAAPGRRSAGTGRRARARAAPCEAARSSLRRRRISDCCTSALQLRLAGELQQHRAGDPDERQPERGAGDESADRVEQPQRRDHGQPAARERARDARDPLQQRRADQRADEPGERRVRASRRRRAASAARARAPISAPAASPPNESAVATSPRRSPDSAPSAGDRERDPVDARHAGLLAGRRPRSLPPLHCGAIGGVVQLVRTPACHAGGRGFESRRSRSTNSLAKPGSSR